MKHRYSIQSRQALPADHAEILRVDTSLRKGQEVPNADRVKALKLIVGSKEFDQNDAQRWAHRVSKGTMFEGDDRLEILKLAKQNGHHFLARSL